MASSPTGPSQRQPGLLVTLEGGEGAGKSFQASALAERLRARGIRVVCTREPGGTTLGDRLRDVLLKLAPSGTATSIGPLAEALLFMAARAQLVGEVISPALARGDVVICDRFADSTRAYQGYGRGVDLDAIDRLAAVVIQAAQPALTVLLDLPVDEGLARTGAEGRADRFGSEERAFHQRVRDGYLALAGREPDRWAVIDAAQPPEAITDQIWRRLEPLLEHTR